MERDDIVKFKKIFEKNFLGPDEINSIAVKLGISKVDELEIPIIPYNSDSIEKYKNTHILILFHPKEIDNSGLSLIKLVNRIKFLNEDICFYNQDWYINEMFARKQHFKNEWLLIKMDLFENSRGQIPEDMKEASNEIKLFSAINLAYTFFAMYFINKKILWKNDFIWTSDFDSNNDRVYVGRYFDPKGLANPGFSIHRHLKISQHYGIV